MRFACISFFNLILSTSSYKTKYLFSRSIFKFSTMTDLSSSSFPLIDFGVNYATRKYKDEDVIQIFEDASSEGVERVVCISNQMAEARRNLHLSSLIPQLHYTIGIHPHNAKQFSPKDLTFLETYATDPKCFGIGEIGLDFNRNFSSKEEQILAFAEQLQLAKRLSVKVYLHCRDAFPEFLQIVQEVDYYNGIVHCFTGNIDEALIFTQLGFKLGVTGWLLDSRRNKQLAIAIADDRILIDKLIVETDAPYMSIKETGRKYSLPSDTRYVVAEIARLKRMDVQECGECLYQNALAFLTHE
jgi:TatD DNase family protein